jgi:hypothetical protein
MYKLRLIERTKQQMKCQDLKKHVDLYSDVLILNLETKP